MLWDANQSADCLYFDTKWCAKGPSDHKKHEHMLEYHVLLAERAGYRRLGHKRVGNIHKEQDRRLWRTPGVYWALTLVAYVIRPGETAGESIEKWHFLEGYITPISLSRMGRDFATSFVWNVGVNKQKYRYGIHQCPSRLGNSWPKEFELI